MRHSRLARRCASALLVFAGIAWLLLNGRYEGPVLFTFDRSHGLTASDLASFAAFAVAAWLWISRTPSKN
jgi:hypothetical protein